MQRLRKIVYFAKNMGESIPDPFQSFRLRFDTVDREILTQEEIDAIYNKEFITQRLEQIRDVFVFSCYTGLALNRNPFYPSRLKAPDLRIGNDLETTQLHKCPKSSRL